MSKYIHVGRQLPPIRRMNLEQWHRQEQHARKVAQQLEETLLSQGAERGIHDEMILPHTWSDDALARLIADVHQVESTPIVKRCAPKCGREMAMISDVRQGDVVYDFGAPLSDAATVLYVYDGGHFISCMVVGKHGAPFLIQRHKGAYIYRVV